MARTAKQTRSRAPAKPARKAPAAKKAGAARKPRHGADFTTADDLDAFREMLLIRRFEERAAQLYGQGKIGGFLHLYIGQEAVVVGLQALVEKGDEVITSYRDHGHMLMTGMDPNRVMAELMGRRDGYSSGKGGSMHMFSRENDFFGGNGIVGAQVPIGTGIAFANRYRKNDRVCFTYFGEGAANQGQVYESFNMAGLWKLPVIYIIENNRYAMGTESHRTSAQADFSRRGASFDIPGKKIDGMDVHLIREAGREAVAWCRSGKGPYILELMTYRYRGHSMSDPAQYRTRQEVDTMRKEHDPIEHVRKRLLASKGAAESELKAIDDEIKKTIDEAVAFAEASPEPDPAALWTDVLV